MPPVPELEGPAGSVCRVPGEVAVSPSHSVRLRRIELEILVTLGLEPMHGYRILREVEARTGTTPGMTTLYRALHRLDERGLIQAVDAPEEPDRRDVFALTSLGRQVTAEEARRLEAILAVAARADLLTADGA